MDWQAFAVEMTKALAWPITALITLFVVRRLLPELTSLRYDKLEVQFGREMAAVQRRVESQLPPLTERSTHERIREQLLDLAMDSPEAAIVEAWRYIEGELSEAQRKHDVQVAPATRAMPMVLAALLYKDSVISEAQHALIQRLRHLRNEVAQGRSGTVDLERATMYVESTLRLAGSLGYKAERDSPVTG